jgi:hypothetical protein
MLPQKLAIASGDSVGRGAFLFGGFLEFTDYFNISLGQLINGTS